MRTLALAAALLGGVLALPAAAQEGIAIPAPKADIAAPAKGTETAVLAGGCFWGVQGVFQHVEGVTSAVSGYAGGDGRHGPIRDGRLRHHRACRVGAGHLRPDEDQLRQDPADLLLGRPRSDRAQPPRAGRRAANTAPRSFLRMPSRRRSPRPTSPSSNQAHVFNAADRDQDRAGRDRSTPPRTIIRTI